MAIEERNVAFLAALMGCQRSLYAYIWKLVPETNEARDVLQKTNLVLIQKEAEFAEVRDFGAWAAGHAYYQVLAHRKTRQRDRLRFGDDLIAQLAQESRSDVSENDTALQALGECLEKLPSSDRSLIEERYRHEKSVNGLASALRRTAASVATSLYRIRQALADCVRQRLHAEEGQP